MFQHGTESFPPLRGLDAAPSNLPLQATELVGRRLLVSEICDLLPVHRAVTLTGVGGVGKTRLALEVGAEVLPKFPDGVWLVDLAPVAHEEMVLPTVAEVLNISAQSGEALITTMVSRLSAKRAVVVLDNCEHVIGPVARAVERVTASAPDVRVLATSREALGIAGERVQPVPPLAEDSDAVELFVQQAVRADPSFDTAASLGAVREVCRRLDGIPLAIELAAARSRHMTAEQIARRLDQRFRLLTGGARTAIERHRTLEATVGWSYDLLEPTDQLVFQRLAVMAAPFDLEAAEAVASGGAVDGWEVLDTLGRLVDKSMVTTVRGGGELRYRLLETLRQFAAERLAGAPDQLEVTHRYARYWCQRAEGVAHAANRSDADPVLDAVDRDIDHYRAAFAHLLTAGDGESPARAFLALSGFWQIRHTREALAWCEQFLAHPLSPPCRVAVLGFAAHAAATLSPARALDLAREAIAVAEDHGLEAPWDAHQARMIVANDNGDVAAYVDAWRDAARAAEATGSRYVVLLTATQRGMFGTRLTADVSEHYESLLAEIEPLDSPLLLALAYVNYGSELCISGSPERGLRLLRAGVEHAARVGPIAYSGLAVVAASCHLLAGNREIAAPWLRRVLVEARDMGQTHLVAEAAAVTALLAAELNHLEQAAALCSAARRHLDRIGVTSGRLPDTCWRKAEEIIGSSSRDVSDARKRGLGTTVEDLVNTALEVLDLVV
ncbi:MAG TPA: NB-ARC domain-containing protein, partial [Thermoleophilia bacterium]|nr:NB-ARC domain-containing protein [Thermoleophilia bacterium]